MANIDTLNSQLAAVGDAIRAKLETQDTYKISEMPDAIASISGGGEPVIESKTITSNGTYTAPSGVDGYSPIVVNVPTEVPWKNLSGSLYEYFRGSAKMFGNSNSAGTNLDYVLKTVETTTDITNIGGLFCEAYLPRTFNYEVPFTFNFRPDMKIGFGNQNFFPNQVGKLTLHFNTNNNILGTDNETISIGFNDIYLVEFPSALTNMTLNPTLSISGPHSIRCLLSFPTDWLQNYLDNTTKASSFHYGSNRFDEFYSIKDMIIPVNHQATPSESYWMEYLGKDFYNVRHLKWNTQNGTPYSVNWTNQTMNLTRNVGYTKGAAPNYLTMWSSEFGSGYRITDSATYELYKNEPTAWTSLLAYSFYNHDSAVETINSLPDTSSYSGANTIKFKGDSGSATDGGAISTLTNEEIAVATAKGWTVTLS